MKIFRKLGCLILMLFVWGNLLGLAEEFDAVTPRNREELIQVFDFVETPMSEVLRVFAELTGTNIVASEEVMNLRITLFLREVTPRRALKTLCKLYNLWFTERDNIIRIVTMEEYKRELTIRRDEKTVVFHLRYASALAVADLISNLFGGRIAFVGPGEIDSFGHIGTGGGGGGGGQGLRARTRREAFIVGREGGSEGGMEGNLLSMTIEELERRTEEREVELENILTAVEERAITYMAVFPRNNSIIARSVGRRILDDIGNFIREMDTPTSQVLLEGKILELTLTDSFKSFFDFDFEAASHIIDVGGFTPLDAATFIYQFMDEQIGARLELFKEEGLVRIIGTPMILSANNAPGEFFIGEERPITIGYEREIREFEYRVTETVHPITELRDIGTKLSITPSINKDGTVTMRFLADVDTVRPGGASFSFVDREGRVITLPIDTVDTSRVENIIVARDGSTLAIGGLIRETEKDFERRVPILGYIPILGFFFRRREIIEQKTEIVFLVTPHIMMVPEEAEAISDEVIRRLSDHPYVKDRIQNIEDERQNSEDRR